MADLRSRTTLPALSNFQLAERTRGELTAQAAKMVPDTQTLISTLLSNYDLYDPDFARSANTIRSLANQWRSNYAKDPFSAFSRQGTNQLQAIQNAVTDPVLQKADALTKEVRKTFAENKSVLNQFNVNNGMVAVRLADDSYDKVYIEDFDSESMTALRVQDEKDYLTQVMGVIGFQQWTGTMPEYDLAKETEVAEYFRVNLRDTGSAAGTEVTPGEFIDITRKGSSNEEALLRRLEGIKATLPTNISNSLQSTYLKETSGQTPYNEWLDQKAIQYATGKEKTSSGVTAAKSTQLSVRESLSNLDANATIGDMVIAGNFGESPATFTSIDPSDNKPGQQYIYNAIGRDVPIREILESNPRGRMVTNEKGDQFKSRSMKDLPLITASTDGKVFMQRGTPSADGQYGQGDFVRFNSLTFSQEALIDDRNPMSQILPFYTDKKGNVAPNADVERIQAGDIDEDLVEKYGVKTTISENGTMETVFRRENFYSFNYLIPREWGIFGSGDVDSDEYEREFNRIGRESIEDSAGSTYINNHSSTKILDRNDELFAGVMLMRVNQSLTPYATGSKIKMDKRDHSIYTTQNFEENTDYQTIRWKRTIDTSNHIFLNNQNQ